VESKTQSSGSQLEVLLNEAKVYNSMGLYEESRDVYTRILTEFGDLPSHSRNLLQEQIDRLDRTIEDRNGGDAEALLSDDELSVIHEKFSEADGPIDPHDRAVIFMETGQYAEALDEFRRLLEQKSGLERFLGDLVTCVLRIHGPENAPAFMEDLLAETSLGKRERAQIKFKLGDELEKGQSIEAAIEMYRSARGIIPEDLQMRAALDAKIAGLSKDSRYAYLLNQGWITREDMEAVQRRADKTQSSVDPILMDEFGIAKEDLGRSLSIHCGVPFKTYDPNDMTPMDIIARLDRTTLEKEGWVPLASYEKEVDVLMEHPEDPDQLRRVREMLNIESVNPYVGIRADIQSYLDRFFREAAGAAQAKAPPPLPTPSRKTRRESRCAPVIPDFVYVEFVLEGEDGPAQTRQLDVLNCSESGIGLLVPKEDADILKRLSQGTVIPDMVFYAPWTLIRADATVRHVTRIRAGKHQGDYLLGVESKDIVENSRTPD